MTNSVPVDLGRLLNEIAAFIRRYVVLTSTQASVVALWVAHTHSIDAFDVTPYLHVTAATKRAGKTRLLELLELLVLNPWLTGKTSAAVLPRKIDKEHPTLLLDESDAAFGGDRNYTEALRGILNAGYRRSGRTSLCVGQGANLAYKNFSTFCAKAVAGIGELPDTVADRSIAVVRRRMPSEEISRLRHRDAQRYADPLHASLAAWASDAVPRLREVETALPEGLNDRAAEVWEPLLAIGSMAGPAWLTQAMAAASEISGDDGKGEPVVELIADIGELLGNWGHDRIPTADVIAELNARDDRPWATWGRGDKPLTARGLASLLGPLGIHPHQIPHPTSGTQVRGYRRDAFDDALRRYLSSNASTRQPNSKNEGETGGHDVSTGVASEATRKVTPPDVAEVFDGLTDVWADRRRPSPVCGNCGSPDCEWCNGPDREIG